MPRRRRAPEFEPVEPDLKDVYFSVMAGSPPPDGAAGAAAAMRRGGGRVVRIREVFRYEFALPPPQPSTWLYAGVPVLHRVLGLRRDRRRHEPGQRQRAAEGRGGHRAVLRNVRHAGDGGLFADAAIRDVAAGMDALLYTTRLRKAEYLGGRFLAALAINSILVFAIPIGLWRRHEDAVSSRGCVRPEPPRRVSAADAAVRAAEPRPGRRDPVHDRARSPAR